MDTMASRMRLDGVVQKIIYRSEASCYTVALIQTSAGITTVCGCFYVLLPGDEVTCYGELSHHAKYGEQFQCIRYRKLFSPHGSNRSAGPEHWQQVEDMLIQIQSYGLTMAEALRVYEHYGEDAEEVLVDNPYRLTGNPVHLSFASADSAAEYAGLPEESEYRLQAALAEVLEDVLQSGHTRVQRSDLYSRTGRLLAMRPGSASTVSLDMELDKMLENGQIETDSQGFVYRIDAYRAEAGISADIHRLQRTWSGPLLTEMDAAVRHGEEKLALNLSRLQRKVLENALTHPVSIITGGPGTGKTTLLRGLLEALEWGMDQASVLLAAPTGRAAKRLMELTGRTAYTIHRLLGARGTDEQTSYEFHRENPLSGQLLIVDEMSMVDIFLFAQLMEALPDGMTLILVGDSDQLSSVGPGQVLQDLIRSEVIPVSALSQVFRQTDRSAIVEGAHCIRLGKQPPLQRPDGEFRFLYRSTPQEIIETLMDELDGFLEQGYVLEELQILCPFHQGETGTVELNRCIRDWANPWEPGVPEARGMYEIFRRGDKVMQMRNDYDKGVFNGNIGQVIHAESYPEPMVEIRFDEDMVIYHGEEMKDLSLAYAISVHKSQGSEFPVVLMPVYWASRAPVTRNLLYTAVTRARQQVVLVGRKQDLIWGIRNLRSRERCSGLADLLQIG